MQTYSVFYRRAFVLATAVAMLYALAALLRPFRAALEWAAVLAFLLHPLHLRLTGQLRRRPALSAGLLTGLTPFVIVLPLSALTVMFARQAAVLIQSFRGRTLLPSDQLLDRAEHLPLLGPAFQWVQANVPLSLDQVQQWAIDGARTLLQSAAALSGSVALGVVGTLVDFFLMLFLLFFLLRDGERMLAHAVRLIPLAPARRERLLVYLSGVLRAVVFGTVATAIIQGALIGVGFALAGLPSPLVLGVLAAAASFIPAVGTAAVLVPAVLYLLATQRWGAALFLALWSIAIAVAEQLLRPMLSRRHGSVSTLAVFVGAIGGVEAFGLIGVVLGPVLLSLIAALVAMLEEWVGEEDGEPPRLG